MLSNHLVSDTETGHVVYGCSEGRGYTMPSAESLDHGVLYVDLCRCGCSSNAEALVGELVTRKTYRWLLSSISAVQRTVAS